MFDPAPTNLNLETWDDVEQHYGIQRLSGFLGMLFPGAGWVELDCIIAALEQCPQGSVVRVTWDPRPDPGDPDSVPRYSRTVPEQYGLVAPLNFLHGAPLYHAPHIRWTGLKPSPSGAESAEPALYTCKYRRPPFRSYGGTAKALPILLPDDTVVWKNFKFLIGVESTMAYPHAIKVKRKASTRTSFT